MPVQPCILQKFRSVPLCTDARFGPVDEGEDTSWQICAGNGEPDALNLQTSLGLRVREMKIFPRFHGDGVCVTSPDRFCGPILIEKSFPNYFVASFIPFQRINAVYEIMVPSSRQVSGRITFTNQRESPVSLQFELAASLTDLKGIQRLHAEGKSHSMYLTGDVDGLSAVLLMLGGVQPGMNPYPSLIHGVKLDAGETHSILWTAASGDKPEAALQTAAQSFSIPWEPQTARVELINQMDTITIQTGDERLDEVFLESQKIACQKLGGRPGFFALRVEIPDMSGDHLAWVDSLEAAALAELMLPRAPEVAKGIIRGTLLHEGNDQNPAYLPAPGWASTSWKVFETAGDVAWLKTVYPRLLESFWRWFGPENDRDQDSFPEYANPLQTWYPTSPLYDRWEPEGRGAAIDTLESPALGAILFHECAALKQIAGACGDSSQIKLLEVLSGKIKAGVEACWDERSATYLPRDRDAHHPLKSALLGKFHGGEEIRLLKEFSTPHRLVIRMIRHRANVRRVDLRIAGEADGERVEEALSVKGSAWVEKRATATSQKVYSRVDGIFIEGFNVEDSIEIRTMEYRLADLTCYLPLWAGIPSTKRAEKMIASLTAESGYLEKYGLAMLPAKERLRYPTSGGDELSLPLNRMIVNGMRLYGHVDEAADVYSRTLEAIKLSFQGDGSFRKSYNVVRGSGTGEQNHPFGLISPDFFLESAGIRIYSPEKIKLTGKKGLSNSIRVSFRGLEINRNGDQTRVRFPNGQTAEAAGTEPQWITLIRETVTDAPERSPMPTQETITPLTHLLIAVVQAQDAENAVDELNKLDVVVTHLPSVGGFLGRRNITLLIGMPDHIETTVMTSLQQTCRQRVEYIAIPLESAPLPLPAPTPITIGGATIFSIELEHYEVI
jgi:uncharacterized protein YaaQ